MKKSQNLQELKEKLQLIKRHPAFSKLAYEYQKRIAQSLQIVTFKKNNLVFNEGDLQSELLIVRTGEFKMTKKIMPQQSDSFFLFKIHTFEICLLQKGETFGVEYFEEIEHYHRFSVRCNSIEGTLFKMDLSELELILKGCISLSKLFQYPSQIQKDRLYLQRENQLQILSLHNKVVKSNSLYQSSPMQKMKKMRSISTDASYCEKIEFIIQGPKQIVKNSMKTEQSYDLGDSIQIKMKQLNLTTSQEDMVNKRRNAQQDRLQRIKILNQLGYKPKVQILPHRFIDYKRLLFAPSNQ